MKILTGIIYTLLFIACVKYFGAIITGLIFLIGFYLRRRFEKAKEEKMLEEMQTKLYRKK